MAGRDNANALLLSLSADTSKSLKALDALSRRLDGLAPELEKKGKKAMTGLERTLARPNLGKALDSVFDRSRLAVFEAGAARIPIFGSAIEALGPAGLAAAAGIGAVVAAFAQAKAAVQFGDAIADAATKVGVSTDVLQEYRYAIHQLGGEYGDADEALSAFTQTLGKAQTIGGKSLKAFKELELDPSKFHDADEALRAVLDKLSRIQDESKRQGLAAALGLEKFIPLAREGTAKLDELREAGRNLGFVMDKDLVAKAGEVNDKLEDLQQVVSVQLASAFVDLAPLVLKVAQAMVDGARFAHDFAATLHDVKTWADSLGLSPLAGWFDTLLTHLNPVTIELRNIQNALRAVQGAKDPLQGQIKDFIKGGKVSDDAALRAFYVPKAAPFDPKAPASGGGRRRGGATQDNTAQRIEQVNATLAQSGAGLYQAMLGLTGDIEARATIEKAIAQQEAEAAQARLDKQILDLKEDKTIKDGAVRKELIAKLEIAKVNEQEAADAKAAAIDRQAAYDLEDKQIEVHKAIIDAQIDELQAQADIATTAKAREKIEANILRLRQQLESDLEGTRIDRAVASGVITPEQAGKQKGALATSQGADWTKFDNANKSPWQKYVDSIKDVDTAFQEMEVNGVQSLVDGLAAASVGAANLGDVFRQTLQQMAMEANKILLQSLLTGGSDGGGGGLAGLLKGALKIGSSLYKGPAGSPGDILSGGTKELALAGGGSFTVGGMGGIDRNLFKLHLSRGEKVTVETPEQQRHGGDMPAMHFHLPGITNAREARESQKVLAAGLGQAWAMAARQGYFR